MKPTKIVLDNNHIIKVSKKETNDNYNIFVHLHKNNEKLPIKGASMNENSTIEQIRQWGINSMFSYNNEVNYFAKIFEEIKA
jgi:hypothetical protein